MPEQPAPEECANCGAAIPRGAKSCPACGADERTGWREQSLYDDLDLPDAAYADDDAPARRRPPARRVNGLAWYWWCAGVAVVIVVGLKLIGL